jgi:acyl-CoA reductase-like NAD-dependent aldehyde dehydrogenase
MPRQSRPTAANQTATALHRNLVAGHWLTGQGELEVHAPWDGAPLGRLALATPAQVERAIAAAQAVAPELRRAPAHQRAAVIDGLRQRVAAEAEPFARLISAEAGKPIKYAQGEVQRGLETLRLSAEAARHLGGEYLPLDHVASGAGAHGLVRRIARGPVAVLWPFNFPLNLLLHKLGPALACGCPALLRPPSATPLTGHRVAELLHESLRAADYPPAAVAYLCCGHEAAAPLIDDPRLAILSFTGSDAVGWGLKQRAPRKQVTLELGGNAALLVEPDADLQAAAQAAAEGAFAYAGQVCISVQRILVHRDVYNAFLPHLRNATKRLKIGDPADPAVTVGPLIDAHADERLSAWLAEAQARGAQKLHGRRIRPGLWTPHLLTGVPDDTELGRNEAFGPVALLETYSDLDAAIARVNGARYGLQAGVFTQRTATALRLWRELELGALVVNAAPTFRVDSMPYGGEKDSGWGREGVRYAVEEYTVPRLLVVKE